MKSYVMSMGRVFVGFVVFLLLPACQKIKEKVVNKFETRAQAAYDTAVKQYRQELAFADELRLIDEPDEFGKEFTEAIKNRIIDQYKVIGNASYPYSTYYVKVRASKNSLEKYVTRLSELNPELAKNITIVIKKLEIILKQTHKAFYDILMSEQRDIDMSTNMARLSGSCIDYAVAVFGKPRI